MQQITEIRCLNYTRKYIW